MAAYRPIFCANGRLSVPEYDPAEALHAAEVAARVELPDAHFTTRRRLIRDALRADGVAETIERLVDALLPP